MSQYIYTDNSILLNYQMQKRIQNIYYNLLIYSLQKHCRIFVMRMDVHLPQEIVLQMISVFNHRFIEKEKNAGYDPFYLAVRELSTERKTHHHIALFLDGNRTEKPYQHFENARIVLGNITRQYGFGLGNIDECNNIRRNGIMLDRNMIYPLNLYEALRQVSYLAKIEQKDNVPGKTYFYSKIPIQELSNDDITRNFQLLFPNLFLGGGIQWYSNC